MEFDHSTDTISPDDQFVITFGGTGGIVIPVGTTAQRPAATNGTLRYNTDTGALDLVVGGSYQSIRGVTSLTPSAVTAVGTTQGAAAALTASYSTITASSGNVALILPTPITGQMMTVFNTTGGQVLSLFPASGASIGSAAANAAYSIPVLGNVVLFATSTTHWEVVGTNSTGGGGGTPGGATTQVQFNNAGAFGGSANLTVNTSTGQLTSTNAIIAAGLNLTSTTSPILLNGSAGTSGQVLTSAGAGATPTWTTVSGGGGGASYTALIGDGTSTSIVVTHSLGVQWVTVQLVDVANNEIVGCKAELTSTSTCTLRFVVAPTTNQYRVTIQG